MTSYHHYHQFHLFSLFAFYADFLDFDRVSFQLTPNFVLNLTLLRRHFSSALFMR